MGAILDNASGRRWIGLACATLMMLSTGCASLGLGKSPEEKARAEAFKRQQVMDQAMEADRDDVSTTEDKIAEGDRLRDSGRTQNAALAYYEAVRMDPEAVEPRERLAYMQLGHDVERAETIFLELVTVDPDSGSAWRGLGLAHIGLGKLADAETSLERAIALDPNSAGAHYGLATVLGLDGRAEEAVEHARRAHEIHPNDGAVSNVLGVSMMLAGDAQGAEEHLRDAVRLEPHVSAYLTNLALSLGRQERYTEALRFFMRAGDEQKAYNNLGYSYFLNGRYDQAITEYERALAAPGEHKLEVLRNLNEALDARDRSVASPSP